MSDLTWSDLHDYQRVAIDWALEHEHAGLFMRPGLGKTVCALATLDTLLTTSQTRRALVLGTKRVITDVWPEEREIWSGLCDMSLSVVAGTPRQREAALSVGADLDLVSHDNVCWLLDHYGADLPYDTLVIDELSFYRGRSSNRSKALRRASRRFDRVLGLTGSPAPRGLLHLWAQMAVLDCGASLGPSFTRYRAENFQLGRKWDGSYKDVRFDSSYELQPGAAERIYEAVGKTVISMTSEDFLDLPERTDVMHLLTMSPALARRYESFRRKSVLEDIPDGVVTAINAAVLVGKLSQFANGAVYDDDGRTHVVHDLKIDAAKALVDELQGEPVIIGYAYRSDLERLRAALPQAETYDDGTKERWDRGEIPVLLLHPRSAGHGLNLQKGGAHTVIWYGPPWSLELYEQLIDRLHRQGQRYPVTVHHLITVGTEDERIMASLAAHDDTQRALLTATAAAVRSARCP